VPAQAYVFTTQQTPGDPRESMQQAALQGLGLVGNRIQHRDEAPHHHVSPRCEEGTGKSRYPHKEMSPHHHNSPRRRSRSRRSRSPLPQHHNNPRHGGGSRRSKSPRYTHDNEDDQIEMGASGFTRRVCRMPVPKLCVLDEKLCVFSTSF
jgi:hypothetical protein